MFRITVAARQSFNFWMSFAISITLSMLALYTLLTGGENKGIAFIILIVAGPLAAYSLYTIAIGQILELVIDGEIIRWGNEKKRKKQKEIPIRSLVALRYTDYDDDNPYNLETKAGIFYGIPSILLFEKNNTEKLISYLREHHPQIKIDLKNRHY